MNWQTECPPMPLAIQTMVQSPSLTQALSQLGEFTVQLQSLGISQHHPYFADFRLPETLFCREVMLLINQQNMVYAQSACLPDSLWCEYLDCGNASLGQLLFSGSLHGLTRSKIQYTQSVAFPLIRRSFFEYRGERLYLAEAFLVDFFNLMTHRQPFQAA